MNITFSLDLKVINQETLRLAAEQRAVDEGMTSEAWAELRTGPESDVQMLLDPGSLPGCAIFESTSTEN